MLFPVSTRGKTPGTRGSWLVCCGGDIYYFDVLLIVFSCAVYTTLLHRSLQITMPPKTKRQIAASLNYRKRKYREEARVEGESTSGDARVEGESTSGDARVEGESTSGDARVEGESISGETMVTGEQSTSNYGEEQDSAVKRPRLEDISTLADEPLQEWLGNLPRDDLRHVALLLYTNLPKKFGLQKTDTAATVADFIQKSERTVRRWIDEFVRNDGEFSDTQQGH